MKNSIKQPPLRFKNYSNDWIDIRLSELGTTVNGLTYSPSNIVDKGLLVLRSSNVQEGLLAFEDNVYVDCSVDGHYKTQLNDILICVRNGSRRLIGKCALVTVPDLNSTHGAFMSIFRGNANKFVFQLFQTEGYYRQVNADLGATINSINGKNLLAYKFRIPCIEEQKKIADFLSTVDKKISLLKEKHALLEQYKKGVMQKLFSQEIRFKDENGNDFPDWKKGTLGDLSDKISNKNKDESVTNVLTNSAKLGIVSQTDYFKKDIANQSNLGGYSIVEKDDFVYNPRISELAPVGPIKRNHVDQGVMSPLYTVFRFKDENVLDYLELYFETTQWHRYMNSIANFGARHDRMNITMGDFFNLPIPVPSIGEMEKIVVFIQSLNKKVDLVAQQLEQTQTFKKGLLQQMFV